MNMKTKTYEQIEFPEGGLPLYVYYTLLSTENEVLRDDDICSYLGDKETKLRKKLLFTALNGYPSQIYSDSHTCKYLVRCDVDDSRVFVAFAAQRVNPEDFNTPMLKCQLYNPDNDYDSDIEEVWLSWNWEDLDWYGLIDKE